MPNTIKTANSQNDLPERLMALSDKVDQLACSIENYADDVAGTEGGKVSPQTVAEFITASQSITNKLIRIRRDALEGF